MLQVARLSRKPLAEAASQVATFLRSQQNRDGGFRDRDGKSDLYYTVFGLEGLIALQEQLPVDVATRYLESFGAGDDLDLVHRSCLARAWACLPPERRSTPTDAILNGIERFRAADGGYHAIPGAGRGTVYGCYLALGAYQDLNRPVPAADEMLRCIESLRAADGGYSNQEEMDFGVTPATAAAVMLLRQLGKQPDPQVGDWLLRQFSAQGGFLAMPDAPMPDLLSTATALHALVALHVDLDPIRELCLDFIDSLWVNRGGFHGNWTDNELDVEYTLYGLLALGHLSH
jgi:prenyltransferase beta subunit